MYNKHLDAQRFLMGSTLTLERLPRKETEDRIVVLGNLMLDNGVIIRLDGSWNPKGCRRGINVMTFYNYVKLAWWQEPLPC